MQMTRQILAAQKIQTARQILAAQQMQATRQMLAAQQMQMTRQIHRQKERILRILEQIRERLLLKIKNFTVYCKNAWEIFYYIGI